MKEYIVETRNLKKYYQMGENTVKALDSIDFCAVSYTHLDVYKRQRQCWIRMDEKKYWKPYIP